MLKKPQPKRLAETLIIFGQYCGKRNRTHLKPEAGTLRAVACPQIRRVPPAGAGGLGEITGPDNPSLFRPEEVLSW